MKDRAAKRRARRRPAWLGSIPGRPWVVFHDPERRRPPIGDLMRDVLADADLTTTIDQG